MLEIDIELESGYDIGIDDIIETFKILKPLLHRCVEL